MMIFILYYFILPLLTVALIAFLKSPMVKGFLGELVISICLMFLDTGKYKVLNDIMIPSGDLPDPSDPSTADRTSQIDHIIVSIYGIFVIETKNFKGAIYGSENDFKWTQVISRKQKYRFYNPILQNKGHVKSLQNLLGNHFPSIKYIPIVVFTSRADFKKLNVTSHVVYSINLLKTIKMYTRRNISPR